MATGTDERRLTAMMTRLFPRLGRPNRLRASGRRIPLRRSATPAQVPVLPAPIPEVASQAALEETTAVARYDAVTRKVAVEDILGADLPASAIPVPLEEVDATVPVAMPRAISIPGAVAAGVAAPAAPPLAAGTTASTRTVRRPRRTALGMLVVVAATAAWGVAAYEAWYLFLR